MESVRIRRRRRGRLLRDEQARPEEVEGHRGAERQPPGRLVAPAVEDEGGHQDEELERVPEAAALEAGEDGEARQEERQEEEEEERVGEEHRGSRGILRAWRGPALRAPALRARRGIIPEMDPAARRRRPLTDRPRTERPRPARRTSSRARSEARRRAALPGRTKDDRGIRGARARGVRGARDVLQRPPRQRAPLARLDAPLRAGPRDRPRAPGAQREEARRRLLHTARGRSGSQSLLAPGSWRAVSSQDLGLPLGRAGPGGRARALPKGAPFQTGGGTARLVAPSWVVWAKAPDRFEAGTPPIINVIAFAKALQLVRRARRGCVSREADPEPLTADALLRRDALERLLGPRAARGAPADPDRSRRARPDGARATAATSTSTTAPARRTFAADLGRRPPGLAPARPESSRTLVREVPADLRRDSRRAPDDLRRRSSPRTPPRPSTSRPRAWAGRPSRASEPVVLNTLLEHNSNELPWRVVPGCRSSACPVDAEGFVDLGELEAALREPTTRRARTAARRIRLVAVSGASNVLGVCNDLAEISRIVHRHGARLLVDAAQLVAHRRVEMAGLRDRLPRLLGPQGVRAVRHGRPAGAQGAARLRRRGAGADPRLRRGERRRHRRAGQGARAAAADRPGRDRGGGAGV